jgi:hypothetical protein
MLKLLAAFVVPLIPLIVITLPLVLAGLILRAREQRRYRRVARQVMVTDAIHRQLGPVVAPVVRKSLWGPWQLEMAVPFARPGVVGTALAIAHRTLAEDRTGARDAFEIVLTPQENPSPVRGR